MAQPSGSDVHVDTPLSNIAIAYKNQRYIADLISPRIPVTKQSDKYFIWTKDFWFRDQVEKRAPGSQYPEAGLELSTDSYYADIFHLAFPINDEDRVNQDVAVQLDMTGAEWLADQFALHRESKISTDIFAINIWDTDVVGGTDFTQWDDYANSTPLEDIDTALTAVQGQTGRDPNQFVVGREVHDKLKRHPNLLDLFKHTSKGILNEENVREAIGIEQYIVASSITTTSKESASSITYSRFWGKNGLLLFTPPNPGLRVPTAMYTFEWVDVGGVKLPITIDRLRDDLRDRDLIRGKYAFDDKVVGTDLGYFFSGAVA